MDQLQSRIEVLSLKPGDVLVVKVDGRHPTTALAAIHDKVQFALNASGLKNDPWIIDSGMSLQVLRQEDTEPWHGHGDGCKGNVIEMTALAAPQRSFECDVCREEWHKPWQVIEGQAPPMQPKQPQTREQTAAEYCKLASISIDHFHNNYVVLPCRCSRINCPQWAVVLGTRWQVEAHKDHYGLSEGEVERALQDYTGPYDAS